MTRTPRRTVTHANEVEVHGDCLVAVLRTFEVITEDGEINPAEVEQMWDALMGAQESFRPLPIGAALLDNGARMIGALANTFAVTEWVGRMASECVADEAALAA